MTTTQTRLSWVAQVIAALIMLQTLFFKFTAAPESVYIFSTLGVEPWGRIGAGVSELIAAILLLIPSTAGIGAMMGLGIMAGAILSHLTVLGIDVQNDGGYLFTLALITALCCVVVAFLRRKTIPFVNKFV
ncbi:MAG: DoxX family protein [Spirosomataceae bacterium]